MKAQTILLAEDEEMLRRLITRALRERGYQVLEAPGGPEALTAASRHPGPIDLLVTDVVMPDLDGSELARRLAVERPEMRVLFISGYSVEADLEAGSNFLGKPFTPRELCGRIRKLLDQR